MQINLIGSIYMMDTEATFFSEKFSKREFVIEDMGNPMYPKYYKCELVNEDTMLLDRFERGQIVAVRAFVEGRKHNKKDTGEEMFFVSLKAKNIMTLDEFRTSNASPSSPMSQPSRPPQAPQGPPQAPPSAPAHGPGSTSGDKPAPF